MAPLRRKPIGSPSAPTGSAIRLCCYTGSEELGGMDSSLSTLLGTLSSQFALTVLGVSEEVVGFVAAHRPGSAVHVTPAVSRKSQLFRILRLVWMIRKLCPDALLINMGQLYAAQYALFAAVLFRIPTVAVVHGVLPRQRRRQDVMFRSVLQRVPVIGAVSAYVARETEAEFRLRRGSVRVLYGAAPDPVVVASVQRRQPDEFVLGAVGRCAPEKGFDVLVRAMDALPACRLVIAGDGPARAGLERLAAQLGVQDRVHFAGWVSAPWCSTLSFDVLVAPSRAEAFGLSVVEAMMAGIPVIASRIGGLPEVIDNEITGLLVPVNDPVALAEAIGRLVADPDLARMLAKCAQASVVSRFSVQAMTRSYEEALDLALRR